MEVYLVGGAVRDELLGLPVTERDWCVVGATPGELEAAGYRQVGKDFPVFAFCPADDAERTTLQAIDRIRQAGAKVIAAGRHNAGDISLSYARTAHPLLDPISLIQ